MAISDAGGSLALGGAAAGPDGGAGEGLLRRLPAAIRDSLTAEQADAIRRAALPAWRGHGVNIRLSLPLPGRRFYLTIVGGPERRPAPRLAAERAAHPLSTVANGFFVATVALFFYGLILAAIFLHAAIIEF